MRRCDDKPDQLKVRVSQSKDGRKKKIRIKNDFLNIKIRVKDQDIDWECTDPRAHKEARMRGDRRGEDA